MDKEPTKKEDDPYSKIEINERGGMMPPLSMSGRSVASLEASPEFR